MAGLDIVVIMESSGLDFTKILAGWLLSGLGTCTDSDIVVPSAHEGLPVTAVADSAFRGNGKIESVELSAGVTVIGSDAFAECSSLKKNRVAGHRPDGGR